MKTFSFYDRQAALAAFKSEDFDLLIIGGGITGAGAARDAAMRGMKVALVEARDFASGTSSRSSKLIHGGIRYLENMEFKLVFEALNERTKLFEMTPHLVHPLRFMIPLYEDSRVGMFKMGLGMWLYDALALFQAPEMHERLNARESLERMSALKSQGLKGSYVYSDAYMDDDRLVHETLRSAHEHGARCANYIKAEKVKRDETGKIVAVVCRDQLSGQEHTIKAQHIISSVGPWTDELGSHIYEKWKNVLRPTKGIHLTFPKGRLPLTSAVVMGAEKGSRIVFGIPRHEMIIIGTTDTDYKGSPEDVVATEEDVRYLLKVIDEYFPGAQITKDDIIASYAGVRPLVADGSASEGKTSREHVIWSESDGITFVAGGKYTTYRLMASQVVDECLKYFSTERQIQFKSANTATPLNEWTGPEAYQEALMTFEHWPSEHCSWEEKKLLAERYGLEAQSLMEKYWSTHSYWEIEAEEAIENTMCISLVDFYARRVPLVLAEADHGLGHLDKVAGIFADRLHWSESETQQQISQLKSYLAHEFAWKKNL